MISIATSTYQYYERGERDIPLSVLQKIITTFKVNHSWLLTGEGEMFIDNKNVAGGKKPDIKSFSYVPLFDVKAAAGAGYINESENITDFLAFKTNWIHTVLRTSPKELFLIHVIGDSMEPTLKEGDIIMGDKSRSNTSKDGIYIVKKDDRLIIKRIQFQGDVVLIKSDNKFYDTYTVPASELEVVGKAVWYGRKM